jgi:hypothetical protein
LRILYKETPPGLGAEAGIAVVAVDHVAGELGPRRSLACELEPRGTGLEPEQDVLHVVEQSEPEGSQRL